MRCESRPVTPSMSDGLWSSSLNFPLRALSTARYRPGTSPLREDNDCGRFLAKMAIRAEVSKTKSNEFRRDSTSAGVPNQGAHRR